MTASIASLVSNAVPIAAVIVLFHERLPHGPLLGVQLLAYGLGLLSAALLPRVPTLRTSRCPSGRNVGLHSARSTERSSRCNDCCGGNQRTPMEGTE